MSKKTTKKKMGRPKGALDMRSRNLRESIQRSGKTPLQFMLDIMRDEEEERPIRLQAAVHAAPYCHAKLQSITVENKVWDGDVNAITNDQLAWVIATGGSLDAIEEEKGARVVN